MGHWLAHWLGLDNGSGPIYLAWSGVLSDIFFVTGLAGLYRRHRCHVHRCWRIARYAVDGTSYVVCRRHHPGGHVTAERVLAAHRDATASRVLARPQPGGGAR